MNKNLHIYRSSAGSGKTYALVRNYISLALIGNGTIFNPRYFRHIIAITFTNKAASEMKERVLSFISDLSKGLGQGKIDSFFSHIKEDTSLSDEEIKKRSKQILTAILHNYTDLSISTIDKFVFRIVRTFAHDLQMAQAFEVEMDKNVLIQPAVSFLISRIGTNKELSDALVQFALNKADEGKSYNLENALEQFAKHLFIEKSEKFISSLNDVSISDCLEVKNDLLKEIDDFEKVLLSKRKKFLAFCKKFNLSPKDFTSGTFYNYFNNFRKRSSDKYFPSDTLKKNVANNKWSAKSVDEYKKELIINHADFLTVLFEDVQKHLKIGFKDYIFNKLLLNNIFSIAVLNELSKELEQFKEENNVKHISEFNNAIAEIIRKEPTPFIYERLGERYHHFLIDEFQDTSVMQWHNLLPLIHNSLSEGYQNLIVGDAKQSIYRWRGGEVEQFVQLPKHIYQSELLPNPDELKNSLLSNANEKVLSDNWRSDKEIVKFNNSFFYNLKNIISPDLQAIYKSSEQNPKGKDGGYIHVDLTPDTKSYKSDVMDKIIRQIEVLRSMNYHFKDIAILCRTRKDASLAAESLNLAGVNVLSDEALLLSASKDVNFILSVLAYLHNTQDKVSQTFMISYLYYNYENVDYSLHQVLESIGNGNSCIFKTFIKSLGIDFKPQELWELALYDLVEQIINVFKLSSNDIYLQYFLDAIHKFSTKNSNDIVAFLEWWDKNHDKEAIVVPDDMDAVKVMTVHKSKGLEFPIVFIPFNWKVGKSSDELWVDAKGKIKKMKVALLNNSKQLERSEYAKIHKEEKDKAIMDDLNVLYVAMTRPKHQLYIYTAEYKNLEGFNTLSKLIGYYFQSTTHKFPISIGKLESKSNHKECDKQALNLNYTSLSNWRHTIRLKNNSNKLWDINLERQKWGSLLHECLAQIHYPKDKDFVLDKLEHNGLISIEMKSRLRNRIEELLNDEQLIPFFLEDWEVKTEQVILQESGESYVPDRLLIKNKKVKIIDYKTGSISQMEKHKKQINSYYKMLKKMGFKEISKYIIYTEENDKIVQW